MRINSFLRQIIFVSVSATALVSVGCGSSEPVVMQSEMPPQLESVEEIRLRLETIEKQGYAGSSLHGLKPGLLAMNNREVTRQLESLEKADGAGHISGVRLSARRILRLL